MRFVVTLFAVISFSAALSACEADSTADDACANAKDVCAGNASLSKVKAACEDAVSQSNQTTINCMAKAGTCDIAAACIGKSSTE
ncbi:MAG: hypothetical protein AMXMBFR64_55290 [Myxococcales bacterium]